MGGRALKSAHTRRYSREEFDTVSNELLLELRKTFAKADVPLFFHSKETFGDIDIILSMEGNPVVNMRTYIEDTFKPTEIFHNGNAYSFDYKEVQVDFITCSEEHYDSNYHYLAFNDLGNFIGRITQKLGLKYGQEGLWYNHYYKDQKVGKVMISKDYRKIFDFLGFDYDEWLKGFETLEDVFEYVIKNRHFDSDMFALQHLNKINRERNAKRKSYMSFLEYIAEKHPNEVFEYPEKSVSVEKANKFFGEARMTEKIREIEYNVSKSLYIKSKFGGGIIARRYGLKGAEIGTAVTGFKSYIESEILGRVGFLGLDYNDFILNTETEDIYNAFEDFYGDKL